jgi:signal transduction histidine kinase
MATSERQIRALVLGKFALIGLFLSVLVIIEYLEDRSTGRALAVMQQKAMRVRLVGRILGDVDRERILIDRHIFEHGEPDMSSIEREIAAVRADFDEAARSYAPLVAFPGEPIAWHQLETDVTAAQYDIAPALAQSRENRDGQAQKLVASLEPLFEKIHDDAMILFDINQQGAQRAVESVTRLQRTNFKVRLALTAAILAFAILGGLLVTRLVVQAQRALVRLNADLENRNRELDAFAGRVAHDLRGPLAAIHMSAELVSMQAPDAKHANAAIGRGVRQIASLVDDLLLLSRIGSMPQQTASAEAVADALREDLGRLVEQAAGTLRLALEPAQIACHPGLLRQALWNLGENAVKYRRPDVAPELELAGRIDGPRYVVRVTDNGLGMSAEDARRAFEPFFRGRATPSVAGTGLGLSIVRRIAEASGGTATLTSTPGRGTTVVISLPLAPASG